jgi:ribulose-phosphate 3-epimerase
VHRVLQALSTLTNVNDKNASIIRGVAINPGTPLQVLEPLLEEVELVLLLAVNPGWGGQQFIHSTITRIASVQQMIEDTGKDILLGVDGGITRDNVAAVAATGVDLIVTGSAVFDGKTPEANARSMLKTVATTTQHRKLRIQTS